MTLEDLHEEWGKDGAIDQTNLAREAANIPYLHNKYYTKYTNEWLKLQKYKADYKKLVNLKDDYYRGILDPEELKARGWKPFPLNIRVGEIPRYVEHDDDVINLGLKIGYQEAIAEFLENIVSKQINNRNFQLKLILDAEKFKNGVN